MEPSTWGIICLIPVKFEGKMYGSNLEYFAGGKHTFTMVLHQS